MQTLKEKLFAHVSEVLEGVDTPTLPAVRSGPWRQAWENAVNFLRRSRVENYNDSELREKLQELHQDIQNQIGSEVGWDALLQVVYVHRGGLKLFWSYQF